jgi:hypothetical protein
MQEPLHGPPLLKETEPRRMKGGSVFPSLVPRSAFSFLSCEGGNART